MSKAKEISALWKQIKPQIGELVGLCCEVEDHAEVTADAYQRGYENGFIAGHLKAEKSGQSFYEDGYQRGLNDAWECTRKIRGMTWDEQREVFGTDYYTDIIALPVSECIEKIRQYEQEKEGQIRVGDEVCFADASIGGVVVRCRTDGFYNVMDKTGQQNVYSPKDITKTGRHFPEIVTVLEKMREGQEQ